MWDFHPASFELRSAAATLRGWLPSAPRPLRVLLVSDGAAYTSEQQFAPWARHARLLRKRFGVVAQRRAVDDAMAMSPAALRSFAMIGCKLAFNTPAARAGEVVQHFSSALEGTSTRLVYFDGDDDPNVQWPAVLAAVDLYVKKHVHADNAGYTRRYVGKTNLTDHVARVHGISFAQDIIPESPGVDPAHVAKIHLGWNIALDDKLVELAEKLSNLPSGDRDIDISCRGAVASKMWTHPLREPALERIDAMAARFRVLAPRDRVGQEEYYREMLRSKICVSPFGYGEICWRDFEAILCGCLLVKPDMGHLRTEPDLFVAGETYVPVRWDFSDLEEKCAHYLAEPAERQAIVDRARGRLIASLQSDWFVQRFEALLARSRIGVDHGR